MKSITCPADLQQYGITCLTGEACNLGLRILCGVNTLGVRLVKECYGINALGEPWNSGDVGSFMLPADEWRTLAVICLLSEFPIVALSKDNLLYGMENEPRNDGWIRRYYRSSSHPHVGTRNVHTFTGRVE